MHARIKYRDVAYTFLNRYKKITSFCQVSKEMHTKENWFLFSVLRCSNWNVETAVENVCCCW